MEGHMVVKTKLLRTAFFCIFSYLTVIGTVFASAPKAPQPAPWGLYLYMAAANDLEPYAWVTLNQIVKAHPQTEKTPIVVAAHFKTRKGVYLLELGRVHDRVSEIADGKAWDDSLLKQATVEVWPDASFDDISMLQKFLGWAKTNFPAERRAFIYSGHGYSWRGFGQDDTSGVLKDGPEKLIRFPAFRKMLEQFQVQGLSFEWIGFDACSIGVIEVGYELRKVTPYLVASTIEVPFYGFPYTKILSPWVDAAAKNSPLPKPEQMVKQIVSEYGHSYSNDASAFPVGNPLEAFKLAAISTAKLEPYVALFKKLADEIVDARLSSTRWFRELQSKISSYDSVADIDALLYYLGEDMPDFVEEVTAARHALGHTEKPESLSHRILLNEDVESIAHVSIKVTPGRYSAIEARRALSAVNKSSPLRWVSQPLLRKSAQLDEILFDIEMITPDHYGTFSATFNPFILGSRAVDISVEDHRKKDGHAELSRFHFDRASDLELRLDFPAASPLLAETHGAEWPEMRTLGVLFTDRILAEDGAEVYQGLEWEVKTGWGKAILSP
jgi:hypothetical protein